MDPRLHRFLLDAFDTRLVADYDVIVTLPVGRVETLVAQAREFVAAAEKYLESLRSPADSAV